MSIAYDTNIHLIIKFYNAYANLMHFPYDTPYKWDTIVFLPHCFSILSRFATNQQGDWLANGVFL